MTIEEYKKQCKDNALSVFDVVNEYGEVMDDAFGIVGFETLDELEGRIDFIHYNQTGFTGAAVLYEQQGEKQMMCFGALNDAMNRLVGVKEYTWGDCSFDVGEAHFFPGILIRSATL